jgi:hypothetical protein
MSLLYHPSPAVQPPTFVRELIVECGLFTCTVDFTSRRLRRRLPLCRRLLNLAHHVPLPLRLPLPILMAGTSLTTPQQ